MLGLTNPIADHERGKTTMNWNKGLPSSVLCVVVLLLISVVSGTALAEDDYNVKLWFAGNHWYLCDNTGKTLYFSKNDSPGVSTCVGECVSNWPIFFIEKPNLGPRLIDGGYTASDFSILIREDGKKQTTFKGWPLYYFIKDQKTGDILGNNLNDVWHIANPALLTKIKK